MGAKPKFLLILVVFDFPSEFLGAHFTGSRNSGLRNEKMFCFRLFHFNNSFIDSKRVHNINARCTEIEKGKKQFCTIIQMEMNSEEEVKL